MPYEFAEVVLVWFPFTTHGRIKQAIEKFTPSGIPKVLQKGQEFRDSGFHADFLKCILQGLKPTLILLRLRPD
jgi:hypothetical protein